MTIRAIIIGLCLSVWVNFWPAYSSLILRSSRGDFAHLSVAFLIPFLALLAFNHFFSRRFRGLSSFELIAICSIGMVAANMQGEWLSGYFLGVVTAPIYFASTQNMWDERLWPHFTEWNVLSDRAAAAGFYEGLPPGAPFPWDAWIALFPGWVLFLGAVFLANFCVVILLRKQWMEHERLSFPIATALLELTGTGDSKDAFANLVRSRFFQIGFALIFGVFCWNVASWFVTALPRLDVMRQINIPIGRGFPPLWFLFQPMTIAFAYFTKSDVLYSIWFFHLLAILQVGIFNRFGLDFGGSDMWCSMAPAIGWQSFGGFIILVLWGLWMARAHLRDVWRKVWSRNAPIDDTGEILSYRTAFIMLILCSIYTVFFLVQSGMNVLTLLTFWGATLILYLGLAHIIAESGLVFLRGPITAQAFTWHVLGVAGMGAPSAVALGLTYTFFCDAKTFAITTLAHVPRLAAVVPAERRRAFVPAIATGALIGATTVIAFTLYQGYYGIGSYNFGVVSFNGSADGAVGSWTYTANRIHAGTMSTDWNRVRFLGIGAVFTGILLYIRYRFPHFPLHPIGFTISSSGVLRSSLFSIFFSWAIKTLVLKFGGLELYRKIAPLFLGMLAGQIAGIALGVVVDALFFPGNGHKLNRW